LADVFSSCRFGDRHRGTAQARAILENDALRHVAQLPAMNRLAISTVDQVDLQATPL